MKNNFFFTLLLLLPFTLYSQSNIGDFFKLLQTKKESAKHDVNILTESFLKPHGQMIGVGINGGWVNTAKKHALFGFDISITAATTIAPTSKKTFDINNCNLETYELIDKSNYLAPTSIGGMDERPVLHPKGIPSNINNLDFRMPDGANFRLVPLPMVNLGMGLPWGFEVRGKFIPQLKKKDYGQLSFWGVGLKNEITDWIPIVKFVPFIHMSVFAGYTNMNGNLKTTLPGMSDNQEISLSSKAFTSKFLVSANFPVIAIYAGVNMNNYSTKFNLNGNFNFYGIDWKDPINLKYNNTYFNANVGMRLNLGFLSLYGDYSTGHYDVITAGVGITFL